MGVFVHSDSGPHANLVEVSGRIVHETDLAVLFGAMGRDEWLPRRFIKLEEGEGGGHVVLMPKWLARKKRYVAGQ